MSNPIRFFEHLRDMYLRYLDSPFDIRYEDLRRERRELLDQDGRIYRYPLIEPVPAYRSSGQSFGQAAHILLNGIWQPAEIAGAAELVSQGLFPPNLSLHQHQETCSRRLSSTVWTLLSRRERAPARPSVSCCQS